MKIKSLVHATHPEVVKSLRRADGQIKGILHMIDVERPCLEIAQQLHAVERAIARIKRTFIQDHLDHCLEDVVGPLVPAKRRSIDDLKEVTKYL